MANETSMYVMFEEIKQALKKIEDRFSQQKEQAPIQVDTARIESLIENIKPSLMDENLLEKLEQIEQAQSAPKKVSHRVSIDITSSWIFLTIMAMGLMLLVSLYSHYQQREAMSKLRDNDLKYRYIKAFNKTDSVSLYRLEDIFEYNRDTKAIKELRKSVEQYEQDVADRARRMEQAKLKEEEAETLLDQADKLKSK